MAAVIEGTATPATATASISSAPVIDVDALLTPIPGDNPAGENLQYSGIYDEIREARRADDNLTKGDWEHEPTRDGSGSPAPRRGRRRAGKPHVCACFCVEKREARLADDNLTKGDWEHEPK